MFRFEFKDESATDAQFDTGDVSNESLKEWCATLAQEMVDASAEARLQDLPQEECGAVVRELRSRGIEVEMYSPNKEDAIVEFSE